MKFNVIGYAGGYSATEANFPKLESWIEEPRQRPVVRYMYVEAKEKGMPMFEASSIGNFKLKAAAAVAATTHRRRRSAAPCRRRSNLIGGEPLNSHMKTKAHPAPAC